jgi:hypothetical protein
MQIKLHHHSFVHQPINNKILFRIDFTFLSNQSKAARLRVDFVKHVEDCNLPIHPLTF